MRRVSSCLPRMMDFEFPSSFILLGDARPLASSYRRRMTMARLIAATAAAGGLMLILAGLSLALSPESASVGALAVVGSTLVALAALGVLARRALAR